MEEKIINVIEKIRPYINMDGGDIEFVKFEDNYVFVKLLGNCAECELQDVTINESVLEFLKSEIPEIEGVINISF